MIDTEWYLSSQIYPPVLRICEHIQGFTSSQLAEAMGLSIHIDEEDRRHADAGDADHKLTSESFANIFKSPVLEECFPDAKPFEVACVRCGNMTRVQPHETVQKVLDSLPIAALPPKPFELYVCHGCKTGQPMPYVANCLSMFIHLQFREFYANGGSSDAVRRLRSQMTYLRALFDAPHFPGCSKKLIRLHEEHALRCVDLKGKQATRSAALALDNGSVDVVLEVIKGMYSKVDHMFVSVGALLNDLPPTRR
jgi:DNA polymerase alpha subunit A